MAMTRTCGCGNVYGRWRPRCPACGTTNDQQASALAAPDQGGATGPRKPREKKSAQNPCVLCLRRVKGKRVKGTLTRLAPTRCPHCNECVHRECLEVHRGPCLTFQLERQQELDKLRKGGR